MESKNSGNVTDLKFESRTRIQFRARNPIVLSLVNKTREPYKFYNEVEESPTSKTHSLSLLPR